MSKMVKSEIKSLVPFVLVFDLIVYAVSLIFKGLNYDMAIGLTLGTALMILNLILLGNASESAIYRFTLDNSIANAKRKMTTSYIFRSLILALAFYISVKLDFVDMLGIMIPFLYPKPIYMIKSFLSTKKEGN